MDFLKLINLKKKLISFGDLIQPMVSEALRFAVPINFFNELSLFILIT